MEKQLELNLVSFLAKRTRLQQGKKMQEVCYGGVSLGTASNIENREGRVSDQKIYDYLENLGIPKTELNDHLKKLEEELEKVEFALDLINNLIDCDQHEIGYQKLKKIDLENYHPFAARWKYLEARYWYQKENDKKSIKKFLEAIEIYRKNKYILTDNFLPLCYNILSLCYFELGDPLKGLFYVNQGIQTFDRRGENKDIIQTLISNKILYLTRSGNSEQAYYLIEHHWSEVPHIERVGVKLSFYKSRAFLLRKANQHHAAIRCAKEGLHIGHINRELYRSMDVLNALGSIYMDMERWEEAEECFQAVIDFQHESRYRPVVDSLLCLAILNAHLKKWKQAEAYLQTAQHYCQQSSIDIYRNCKVKIMYGNIYHAQGLYLQAIEQYDEAIRLAKAENLPHVQYVSLLQKLGCLVEMEQKEALVKVSHEIYCFKRVRNLVWEDDLHDVTHFWV